MRNSLPAVLLMCCLISCQEEPCINENAALNSEHPDSPAYKAALADAIAKTSQKELHYRFRGYEKADDGEYLLTEVKGKGLCGRARVLVNDWKGLEPLRTAAPAGYNGAVLAGMRVRIRNKNGSPDFVLAGLHGIED